MVAQGLTQTTRRHRRPGLVRNRKRIPANTATIAWAVAGLVALAAAWACTVPAPDLEPKVAPLPPLEATPEFPPPFPPRDLYVVNRTEHSLAVVWNRGPRATSFDVRRSESEDSDYAVVATGLPALGLVDEGLRPDTLYYYQVRTCNHLGCSDFSDDAVAGITESDADVGPPPTPTNVQVGKKYVDVFPDLDVVTWDTVEAATYYEVFRAGNKLTAVSAPLTRSAHTDLGRSFDLSLTTYYQVRACNKSGCSDLS